MNHPYFGLMTKEDDCFKTEINGKPYTIDSYLFEYGMGELAVKTVKNIEQKYHEILNRVSNDLLPMYNDSWKDEEDPILNSEQFINRLKLCFIDVQYYEDDEIHTALQYEDDGLFGYHWIRITVEKNGDLIEQAGICG